MKLANFKYTDLKGKESQRKVLVTGSPSNKYSGIDVSECSDEEIATFVVKYEKLHDKFISDVENLQKSMDMKYNYRQFIDANMSEMTTEIV